MKKLSDLNATLRSTLRSNDELSKTFNYDHVKSKIPSHRVSPKLDSYKIKSKVTKVKK